MSSSAALEGGMAFLLNELLGARLTRPEMAVLCRRSSNTFLGIPTGIMDQYASLNGQASGPILLDCATVTSKPVKNAIRGYNFVLVNSMVSHDLSDGAYAARVEECALALQVIQSAFPGVARLSDARAAQLEAVAAQMDAVVLRRARYVIAENDRVRSAVTALEAGSAVEFGTLLNASHRGLRDEYEVSCPELDYLQALAISLNGVVGARMMGGGFGGCTINLVARGAMADFKEQITLGYRKRYDVTPEIYPVHIGAGTSFL